MAYNDSAGGRPNESGSDWNRERGRPGRGGWEGGEEGWEGGAYGRQSYSGPGYERPTGYGNQSDFSTQAPGGRGYAGHGHRGWSGREFGDESGQHRGRGPKNYRRGDDRIEEDVNEELTRHGAIDASDIEVEVKDGEVTLTGHVDSRRAKRLAEDIAEECSGVRDVHNQLRVRRHAEGG